MPRQEDLPTTDTSLYPGHVPINPFQRALLTLGSAVMGLVDTHRHGLSLSLSFLEPAERTHSHMLTAHTPLARPQT